MPLDDLFRRIGLPEGLAPAVRPRWVEEAALAEEPEITPEPVPVEEPPEPPPVKPLPTGEEAYITPVIRRAHPLLPETILGRLTPLQQVVLMREILGQPRGLRGNIR